MCADNKQYSTILTDKMIGADMYINTIVGDCPDNTELHRDGLLRSDFFVEYRLQTLIKGGIQQLAST